jgi:hypothetical protein
MMPYKLTVCQSKVEIKQRILLVSFDEALDWKIFWPWLFKSQEMERKRIS